VSEEDAERIEEEVEDEDECEEEDEDDHAHHHTPRSEEERSAARAARKAAKAAARGGPPVLQRAVSAPTPPPPRDDQVRIHALTLRELSVVDESPPQLVAPRLSAGSEPGRVADCRASYGKAGRAKAFRGPAAQVRGPVVVYGEDVLAEAELLLPASVDAEAAVLRPKWVRAMGVFDGHGLMGKEAARLAAERFIDDMRRSTMQTLGALLAGDVARVRAVEQERFRALDAHLETALRSPTGGTTCSAVQVHAALGKAFVVVSNVGDSPVLLVENRTGRVALLTGRHSWDNPEERQRYLDRCASLGLTPRDVVYGRINCGGMQLEDADGGEEPFRMYLPGTATVCTRTRDHLNKQVERRFRNSIGGSQSMRRFVWERRDEVGGGWEVFRALEEHAHGNWGATVLVGREGKIQMSRSLGDSQEKQTAYIWSEPDVAVHELGPGEDWTLIACSDGVADLWYFHELGEMAAAFFARRDEERAALVAAAVAAHQQQPGQPQPQPLPELPAMEAADGAGDAQALAQLILEQTMERGERTPGYGIGPRMSATAHLKRPMWDDVCVHCARIIT
jgi:serine/threonine protein phosphatase PrpC